MAYENSYLNPDGSINCSGVIYCDQVIHCNGYTTEDPIEPEEPETPDSGNNPDLIFSDNILNIISCNGSVIQYEEQGSIQTRSDL